MESSMAQVDHTEPIVNASTIPSEDPQTKPSVDVSPSVTLLPPNDASIITLLAAEAKGDRELEAQVKSWALIKLDHPYSPARDLNPLRCLILGIHQRLQKQHGLPVDPSIFDPARKTYWEFENTWGVRVSQLRTSLRVSQKGRTIANCYSSPRHTSHTRH